MRHLPIIVFLGLGFVWGSNFIFMKWAAEAIDPGQIAFLRVLFGLVPVVIYAAMTKAIKLRHVKHIHHFVVMSLLATAIYLYAFAAGTSLLESGIAGALSGAIPLFSFVAAAVFLKDESINPVRVFGVVLGFAGVVLVARPWETGTSIDLVGVGYMMAGSLSVGVSFVYAKKFLVPLKIAPAALTTYQMALGLGFLALVTSTEGMAALGQDPRALWSLILGLGLLGTGVAYIFYYYIVDKLGAITASSATYIPPVVALAIGALLVGEPIGLLDVMAVGMIIAGVVVLRIGQMGRFAKVPPPA